MRGSRPSAERTARRSSWVTTVSATSDTTVSWATKAAASRATRRRPARTALRAVCAAATESQPRASETGTVVRPKERNTSCATSSAWSREPSTLAATPTTSG